MGYDVLGLELSRTAAAHAAGPLGRRCARAGEAFAAAADESFDVIVMADVIEHLETRRPRSTPAPRCWPRAACCA
jgi:2-polyprenyl-3-methyl-5-hydroxy-6-metoxy-1,4-benzoquinol methylase